MARLPSTISLVTKAELREIVRDYVLGLLEREYDGNQSATARATKIPQPNISAWGRGEKAPTWLDLWKLHEAGVEKLDIMMSEIAGRISIRLNAEARDRAAAPRRETKHQPRFDAAPPAPEPKPLTTAAPSLDAEQPPRTPHGKGPGGESPARPRR